MKKHDGFELSRREFLIAGTAAAAPTLREQEVTAENVARDAVLADPIVSAALTAFPGSKLIDDFEQRSAVR